MKDKFQAFIAIGSNLAEREKNIQLAISEISTIAKIKNKSKIIETDPIGYLEQGKFLNMVIEIETDLTPIKLLTKLQEIEHKLGRVREIENGPRTIDLDIILYEDKIINQPHLQIPHPEMHKRNFVMEPLNEIAPSYIHPKLNKTIKTLTDELRKN